MRGAGCVAVRAWRPLCVLPRLRLCARRPRLVPARLHPGRRHPDVREPQHVLPGREQLTEKSAPSSSAAASTRSCRTTPASTRCSSGEITSAIAVSRSASTSSSWRRATLTMTAQVELRDVRGEQGAVVERRADVPGGVRAPRAAQTALDPAAFFDQERTRSIAWPPTSRAPSSPPSSRRSEAAAMPRPATAAVRPRSRSPPARRDPLYLLVRAKTMSRSRRSRHEFAEMVDEGLRAFNVERIHGGD